MGSFTPPPTTALSPGDRLDRYELLCVLAHGGMGTVWLARMTGKLGFERLVALKTILQSYSNDRQFCDMFLDEAGIAARVDHENVARILEIGEDRGVLYYAMELIEGESLRKLYRDVRAAGARFPMGAALRVAADACAGLHAVHELRGPDGAPLEVVHRDVSPQNLLVTVRGTTKLIDFGVAKANSRRTEETAAGTLKGKIEYMAPEQARGEPLDRRADVYSMGALLYELLAGRPVRLTEDGRQLVALHELMTGVPHDPLPRDVPDLVRAVLDRALARDPTERYRTAEELRYALEQVMLATGEAATTDDVAKVLAHFSRERTEKRRGAIEQALRFAAEGRYNAQTLVAPLSNPQVMQPASSGALPATGSGAYPASSAHALVAVPGDGPATGPSMRTIQGAAVTARPSGGSSAGKVVGALVVLGLVGLLGVVGGVLLTRRGLPPALANATAEAPPRSAPREAAPAETTPAPTTAPITTAGTILGASDAGAIVASEPADAPASSATASSPSASPTKRPKAGGKAGRGGTRKPEPDGDEYGF